MVLTHWLASIDSQCTSSGGMAPRGWVSCLKHRVAEVVSEVDTERPSLGVAYTMGLVVMI